MKCWILTAVVTLGLAVACRADEVNLIFNGSFEMVQAGTRTPEGWTTSGNPSIRQRLSLDVGHDGGHGTRLDCTVFNGDGPDFHAMVCQVGKVSLRQGQRYKLSFWAKADGLMTGGVEVGLVNTRNWVGSGLEETFTPGARWERFEFLFQCKRDVPAATSRLQIWFKSTGTLWLDDVTLAQSSDKTQWYPQIGTDGVTNAIPNSSFECGTSGWGSLTSGLGGWERNLFRLVGECDARTAKHGRQSLKIALDAATAPVYWFDYYQPVREPVKRALAANRGWIKVKPGEPIWITEWGCYADDDPPTLPQSFGDATMNRCRWPSERAATEHIVKFAAVGIAHVLRKLFFHAGTAGRINGSDAGGVLFEYDGAPRTMYAGLAAFTKMTSTVSSPLQLVNRDDLHGYVFSTNGLPNGQHPVVALAWSSSVKPRRLAIDPAATAFDLMGNAIGEQTIELTETPVYLLAQEPEPVLRTLAEGR